MPTYPLATLGVTIDSTGISAPSFADIINSLVVSLQTIYGSDIVLIPSSQDYQFVAAQATAFNDENNATIAAYLGFQPGYAQGVNLSGLVLINGIQRQAPTNSTAPVSVFGTAGTIIAAGVVIDQNGFLWDLPPDVTIPSAGFIAVTAVCETTGAIVAPPNTITIIENNQIGWHSVTNAIAATPGAPVESDATLRQRQKISTGLAALTPLGAIAAAVANVPGVTRSKVYQNDEAFTDANGIPSHSISAVVSGGDSTAIAQVIEAKKSPGTGTYGTTSVIVFDPEGVPVNIKFFILGDVQVWISVTIKTLNGYVSSTGDALVAALVEFVNTLPIGQKLYYNWLFAPAQLDDDTNTLGQTYVVTSLFIGTAPSPSGQADIPVPFNEASATQTSQVILTVT